MFKVGDKIKFVGPADYFSRQFSLVVGKVYEVKDRRVSNDVVAIGHIGEPYMCAPYASKFVKCKLSNTERIEARKKCLK